MYRERIFELFLRTDSEELNGIYISDPDQDETSVVPDGARELVWLARHHRSAVDQGGRLGPLADAGRLIEVLGYVGRQIAELASLHILYQKHPELDDKYRHDLSVELRRAIIDHFAERHRVRSRAFWGKSISEAVTASSVDIVASQVVGALYVATGYQYVFEIASLAVSEKYSDLAGYLEATLVAGNPKSALQRHSQSLTAVQPHYEITERAGPEHNLTFRCRVTVGGKTAEATGNSKKSAEQAAAQAYLLKFAPSQLLSKVPLLRGVPSSNKSAGKQPPSVPAEHKRAILSIAQAFNIPSSDLALVRRAMTTRLYSDHTGAPSIAPLAQLGSQVMASIVTLSIVAAVLPMTEKVRNGLPHIVAGHLLREAQVAKAWALLPFEAAMLCPQSLHITDATRTDLIQALLGAALASHLSLDAVINKAPKVFLEWIDSNVSYALRHEDAAQHPKTALQEWTTPLDLRTVYDYEADGPEHGKLFRSVLSLKSLALSKTYTIKGEPATNLKDADARIASVVLRAVNEVNQGALAIEQTQRELHQFLLDHSVAALPKSEVAIAKWVQLGALGCRFLKNHEASRFWDWGRAVTALLKPSTLKGCRQPLLEFYGKAGALSVSSLLGFGQQLGALVSSIQSFSEQDSHEVFSPTIARLQELSKIFDLATRPSADGQLSLVVEDLKLLRVLSGACEVSVSSALPEFFVQRDQLVTNLLCDAVLVCAGSIGGGLVTSISAKPYGLDAMLIELGFAVDEVVSYPSRGTSDLWRFYFEHLPIISCSASTNRLRLAIGLASSDGLPIPGLAHLAFVAGNTQNHTLEREASRRLHDIKNCLIACRSLLANKGISRTAQLRTELEVRVQLERAVALSNALSSMGGSVQVHEIEEFDLAEFMSTYVLSLMARRDVGVRITTPVTRERTVIASEPKVLQLVLDNLCKNSFEAMPRGGDLKIDWVLENDWVLIEVQDSGTGMPQKLLRAILDGEPVQSAKRSGSGIGMLSVIALLRSVGGRFDGSSLEGKGTSWIISLPIREAT